MDKTIVHEIEFKYLVEHQFVERYSKKRKKFQNRDRLWSRLLRFFGDTSEHKRLLNQELLFQDEMREDLRIIIKSKNLTVNQLTEYTHALKILNIKYLEKDTHYLLGSILLGIGISICIVLNEMVYLFIYYVFLTLVMLVRMRINDTAPIYKELILLIDEYVDSKEKT
jgi:hypothetical protein